MSGRAWFPLIVISFLPALVLPGRADEKKQLAPRVLAEITDMEFEVKKRELAVQMAEFGVKEAEFALERVDLQRQQAQAHNDNNEMARVHVDRQDAAIHIEMRKLATQAARLELEQAQAKLKRVREMTESKPAIELGRVYMRDAEGVLLPASPPVDEPASQAVPIPLEHLQGLELVSPPPKEEVDKVVGMIEKLEKKSEQAAAIEGLLKQRRDTLQEMVDFAEEQYRAGHVQQDAVVRASESLIEAELDLATDKTERIALRERRLEIMKRMEEYTKAQREVAKANNAEVLAATAERLKAEIELLRERASRE
jgi:hypothetical protein